MPEDAADVALAQSGDAQAFERLYRAQVARIHSLARRMVGPAEADELTQDVFVRGWQKLHTFRGEAAFGTWLHRLGVNVMLAYRGAQGARRRYLDQDADPAEVGKTRPASLELRLDFETAIGRLPPGARQIFVLHDVEGYKHEEIAGMLGITAGTSKAQLHRARMALRRHLER
ncbi:MAG: RNA polymerase sigma factor [Gemmatimonadetes bacterium]|nr:RNA polymerase sigma factor [Gemmatimonadota bacterium]MBI2535381.1 RNA polymerase sigma factor [Gemmatimonadota bacterium]MBI2614338.1 RNA polymerase sigma factor [Gemmatimonadota bacterium]